MTPTSLSPVLNFRVCRTNFHLNIFPGCSTDTSNQLVSYRTHHLSSLSSALVLSISACGTIIPPAPSGSSQKAKSLLTPLTPMSGPFYSICPRNIHNTSNSPMLLLYSGQKHHHFCLVYSKSTTLSYLYSSLCAFKTQILCYFC